MGKPPAPDKLPPLPDTGPAADLARARDLFREGRTDAAKLVLADLLDAGYERREVYLLLADVYRYEGRHDLAEANLQRAAEAPSLAEKGEGVAAGPRRVWVPPPAPVLKPVLFGGLAAAVLALAALRWVPWRWPVLELDLVPLAFATAAGLLAGSALAASGFIRTWDQELSDAGYGVGYPLWLMMLAGGLVSAFLGAGVYLVGCWNRAELGRTALAFLSAFAGLAVLLAVGRGTGELFWWLGLNCLFESLLIGWALGGIASPREWWQE